MIIQDFSTLNGSLFHHVGTTKLMSFENWGKRTCLCSIDALAPLDLESTVWQPTSSTWAHLQWADQEMMELINRHFNCLSGVNLEFSEPPRYLIFQSVTLVLDSPPSLTSFTLQLYWLRLTTGSPGVIPPCKRNTSTSTSTRSVNSDTSLSKPKKTPKSRREPIVKVGMPRAR